MASEKLLTSKDLADALGVSESSLRRWTNSGAIRTARTAGGHRRIPLSEAIRFIRETRAPVARPQILGLTEIPAGTNSNNDQLFESLKSGDVKAAKGHVLSLYLNGMSIAEIADGPMREAMHKLGELWQHGPEGILIEHRATDICLQVAGHLRYLLGDGSPTAPVALGGAPEGDSYIVPSVLAAAVLTEVGHRTINFGPQTPVELLATAAGQHSADFAWLSISVIANKSRLQKDIEHLAEQLNQRSTPLVLGGRHANELDVRRHANVHVLRTMAELAAFAKARRRAAVPPEEISGSR